MRAVVSLAGVLCFGGWIFLRSHFPRLREPRCTGGENFGTPAPLSGKKRGRLVGTCVGLPNVATPGDTLPSRATFMTLDPGPQTSPPPFPE